MSDLAIREEAAIERTETALILPDGLDENGWRAVGEDLGRVNRASAWWIGDWVNYGEAKWGEKYSEAEQITGLAYPTLRDYASVAKRYPIVVRHDNLSFAHHQAVAYLPSAAQREELLSEAEAKSWTRNQLRAELAAPKTPQKISPQKRHAALIDAAAMLARIGEKWEREMTDALAPPQARKQLTVLRKARDQLDEVIEAVEYRADTLATFRR